jgi:YggT family protein
MNPILTLIDLLINLFFMLLLARVLLPIFGIRPYHPVMQWVYRLTEPVLAPIRSFLPQRGMLDFSPMVAILILYVLQTIVAMLLS